MFASVSYFLTQESWRENRNPSSRYLLLVAEHTGFVHSDLPADTLCCGGIFPYVLFQNRHYDAGIVAVELADTTQTLLVPSMSEAILDGVGAQDTALFVIVDGLSSHIVTFLEALFEETDFGVSIIGGGGGKLTLKQEPVIFTNTQILQDAALIVGAKTGLSLGVGHGWAELMGPLMATKTNRNILQELNYKNAFSVYKEVVEADSGLTFTEDNFFEIAKSYPFGVKKYGSEMIVRDPIATDNGALILVGEMDEGAVVSILKGEGGALIGAAKKAALEAANTSVKSSHVAMVIDCVSRVLFLEEDFSKELEAIGEAVGENALQFGALTLGEIANNNSGNIEFYNKTCVVGVV